MSVLLFRTKIISFFIQIVSAIIAIYALTRKINPKDNIIKQILAIEMFVQFIQMSMYIWLIINFYVPSMALTRYIDWIITTPLMLLTLMLYFKYEMYISENKDTTNLLNDFFKEDLDILIVVILLNLCMLLFGLAGEKGYITKQNATLAGFIPLILLLLIIYNRFVSKSKNAIYVFIPFSIVWSLYGIAYTLEDINKNIFYNILDVIAKNFFGILLSIKLISLSNQN